MNDNTPDHDSLLALIPEYVNGQLGEADCRRLERAASEDARIASEIAVFRGIRGAVRQEHVPDSIDELGWRRLQRALPEQPPAVTEQAAGERTPSPLWRAAAAVLAAVVLGQAILLSSSPTDPYVTAGEEQAVSAGVGLQVAFQPDASELALRQLLLDARGQIVAGPSALGLYELRFADAATRENAVARLRARPDLIVSATLP